MNTAIMLIASAFHQPQSKKCFINDSQIKSTIIDAIIPVMKKFNTAPITVPKSTIQTASVNFALSLPDKNLPTIHNTGDTTTTLIIISNNRASKFIANFGHQLFIGVFYF